MPYREMEPGDCPACPGRLVLHDLTRTHARVCSGCGGLWLDRQDVADTLKYGGYNSDMMAALRRLSQRRVQPPENAGAYPCWSCRSPMRRETIQQVVVDRCDEHGVWFDHDELKLVLERTAPPGQILLVAKPRALERTTDPEEQARLNLLLGQVWPR